MEERDNETAQKQTDVAVTSDQEFESVLDLQFETFAEACRSQLIEVSKYFGFELPILDGIDVSSRLAIVIIDQWRTGGEVIFRMTNGDQKKLVVSDFSGKR